jgi:divalent metal cation (Fe/Co/Zn/Cd) transporter
LFFCLFGTFFSVFLFFWKRRVGNVLQSLVVQNDAKCSGFAGLNSLVVLVGLALDSIWQDLAFVDHPCVGVALALFISSSSTAKLADANECNQRHRYRNLCLEVSNVSERGVQCRV